VVNGFCLAAYSVVKDPPLHALLPVAQLNCILPFVRYFVKKKRALSPHDFVVSGYAVMPEHIPSSACPPAA
jgi:hypothetical protein